MLRISGLNLAYLTGVIILIGVFYKFASKKGAPQKTQRNFVDTFAMLAAVLLMFPFINRNILPFEPAGLLKYFCYGTGAVLLVFGAAWHIWAKINIGRFWSDNIEMQDGHKIITSGAYALARHPMYGSLILWCAGAGFISFNLPALLIAFLVFTPMVIHRAKAEEKFLAGLDGYEIYKNNVRMMLPIMTGAAGLTAKIFALGLFVYAVITGMTWGSLVFLAVLHLLLGYSLKPEKVAFSYRSKTGMMAVIFLLSLSQHWFYYLYYLIIAMFIYGLKRNCPCMLVYEKYRGCPCFAFFKGRCAVK